MAPPRADEMSEDSESDFVGLGSDDEVSDKTPKLGLYDKDSDEEELERLVLGNKAGFRENLFKSGTQFGAEDDYDLADVELADVETGGMEDLEDDDLFMIDTAPGAGAGQVPKAGKTADQSANGEAPAWEDSDDDRLAISLAGATRLRKLRTTEKEDIISGSEYNRRLRKQYLTLNPLPAWAKSSDSRPAKRRRRSDAASDESGSDSDSSDVEAQPLEQLLRDVNKLAGLGSATRRKLRPEVIGIQRTREIPDTHRAPVECLSFHPSYPVLLSASTSSIVYMHHIAPEAHPTPNPQLTSVQVKGVDVRTAQFLHPQGDKVFMGGRRKYFHHWDLPSGVVQKTSRVQGHGLEHKSMEKFKLSPCGRYMGIVASTKKGGGIINVLSTQTTQWIAAARLASRNGIADFAWWGSGDGMAILGKDGSVGEYSMESRTFLAVWYDEGNVGGTAIALGGHGGPQEIGEDRWVAVGSNSGIANVYERNDLVESRGGGGDITLKERPEPRRRLEQLITAITQLVFSPDGQLLAFGSRLSKDALKLVHLPSCTVYRNWPTQQTPLGRITAVAFGQQSDLLAVGNDRGKIRLWQILN